MKAAPSPKRADPAAGALREGLAHHQAGRLAEAGACYRRALRAAPDHPDALHLLGLATLMGGAPDRAIEILAKAAALRPRVADYQVSLGNARLALGDLEGARAGYAAATRLAPANAAAHSSLGNVLRLQGAAERAAEHLERACQLAPDLADPRINLGILRLADGRVAEAVALLERACQLAPGSAVARLNLGAALQADGRIEASRVRYREAVALDPSLAPAHRGEGVTLQLLGRLDEAIAAYRRAVALAPDDADALTNLGVALLGVGRVDDALAAHEAAILARPGLAAAWLNRGTALHAAGRLGEARASLERSLAECETAAARTALGSVEVELAGAATGMTHHQRAITLAPEFADAHWNLALALLQAGHLASGWDEYAWRWRASNAPAAWRSYPWPEWRGEPVAGRRILLWREQGLGDELLFLTCLPDLLAAGAAVTLLVSTRLVSLVRRAFPGVSVVADDARGPGPLATFDCHAPLGALPRWLRRSRASFPASAKFLVADHDAQRRWRERLAALPPGRRVGVCWRSGLVTAERRRHYASLGAWAPVLRQPGITWVNLQYDECEAELAAAEAALGVRVHRWSGEDLRHDLENVAGLIASLDGVVTAPTLVSSIAGALAVPTRQVDSGSDWTLLGERRSPWFPSIESARRTLDWTPAMAATADGVRSWVGGGGTS